MAGNLKKFVNPRFIKTIDMTLMKALLLRHDDKFKGFSLDLLDQDERDARESLQAFLAGAEDTYPEGLRADLHRIADWATPGDSKSSRRRRIARGSTCFRR